MRGRVQLQNYFGNNALELHITERHFLMKVAGLLDWAAFDRYWSELSESTGNLSIDPLICFKMLLLEDWYGFPHSECAAQCEDRLSFRRFLGLSPDDTVPDEAVLVRFCTQLAELDIAGELFAAVLAQVESAGVVIKRGTMVDAAKARQPCARKPESDTDTVDEGEQAAPGCRTDMTVREGTAAARGPLQADVSHASAPAGVKLSVVSTLYRSAPYISEFHRRAGASARQLVGNDYEIILVNDGSPDESLDLAVQLSKIDDHVVLVDLSRNFGHHKAIVVGLEHALGDLIFLIDSDLEEEPEWLLDFSALMAAEKADVVYGKQRERKGGWFEKWSGEVYYSVFNWLCNIDHPRNIVTARLMTRRYVDALLRYREREAVISCLWVSTGFKQCEKIVKKHMSSSTTYSLPMKIEHAMNAITSFSEVPLKLIFYLGISLLACALGYAGYLSFNRVFLSQPMDGWTSVMVSIWVFGGLIISFVGILGIYLAKVFSETKQRPNAIVREVYGRSSSRN